MRRSTKNGWEKEGGGGRVGYKYMVGKTNTRRDLLDQNPSATYLVADSNVSEAVGETVFVDVVVFVTDFVAVVLDVTVSDSLGVRLSARV